jgi:saccharopine dehydrogenase (NAD+, L-lysine forming)
MMFRGEWAGKGVFNVEQLPSVPFLEELAKQGLPWHVKEIDKKDQKKLFDVET